MNRAVNHALGDAGPASGRPDLDWSQVRETVRMLNLAIAQIEVSMREGDESVETLTHSFTSMTGSVQVIGRAARQLQHNEDVTTIREAIESNCEAVGAKMHAAIVAFQFYDKLTQRVSHVRDSLAALSDLVDDPRRLYSPFEWYGLQEKIRSKYTMEDERAMFDALLAGATVEDALSAKLTPDPEVELF